MNVLDEVGHLLDVGLGVDQGVHATEEELAAEAIRSEKDRKGDIVRAHDEEFVEYKLAKNL